VAAPPPYHLEHLQPRRGPLVGPRHAVEAVGREGRRDVLFLPPGEGDV